MMTEKVLKNLILGNENLDDPELLRRQQNLLAQMRIEVERLQPKPTSAHRRPAVYLPGELENATHVFVRRGGVQPSLTAPFEGPFRVSDRNDQNFDVVIPFSIHFQFPLLNSNPPILK